jgi:hypothetical protein
VQNHPVAIQAATVELIRSTPQVQPEPAVVEFSEIVDHKIPVVVEIDRPLLKCKKITPAI